MGTSDGWSLNAGPQSEGLQGPQLGRSLRKAPRTRIQQILNTCSRCFPVILIPQLNDEITVESPNVGSGGEGTELVQRQVGHTTSVLGTPAAPDTHTQRSAVCSGKGHITRAWWIWSMGHIDRKYKISPLFICRKPCRSSSCSRNSPSPNLGSWGPYSCAQGPPPARLLSASLPCTQSSALSNPPGKLLSLTLHVLFSVPGRRLPRPHPLVDCLAPGPLLQQGF